MTDMKQDLLRNLPSIHSLLESRAVAGWLAEHPRSLVTTCLRETVEELREQILSDAEGRCGPTHVTEAYVLQRAHRRLTMRTTPNIRPAINAAGIILHTALGRAVWPQAVTESCGEDLKGYVVLATDVETGTRSERDNRLETLLTELTGAEAATVVNNNAAATLLVLAALGAGREVVVSRGQLIEIGGAFRLPDVMEQSGARMVEVGTTNRTHLRDYRNAITEDTALLFRAHPSNYRVVGFHKEVPIGEMAALAHQHGLAAVDDLGAGALVDLQRFGLPHEPTVLQSLQAGADVALFSGDKLIGGPQAGIIVGRSEYIRRIRRHPLARALRPDKVCLMGLERTLMLFRDVDRLCREHPLYRMLSETEADLRSRAERLVSEIDAVAPCFVARVRPSSAYLGSGSCPMKALPSFAAVVTSETIRPDELARALRLDEACVFGRVEDDAVWLDVRALWDHQLARIAEAMGRICQRLRTGDRNQPGT
ncbi:MAG: L-seryl-tRNA(Sec) selenium transferase [Phycisphaerae bacterium]